MDVQRTKYGIKTYGVASFLLIIIYYLLDLKIFEPWGLYVPFLKKLTMSLFLIALIYLISKVIIRVVIVQTQIQGERYNLLRVIRFLAIVFSLIVVASFLLCSCCKFRVDFVSSRFCITGSHSLLHCMDLFDFSTFILSGRSYSDKRISWRCCIHKLFGHFDFGMQWRLFGQR